VSGVLVVPNGIILNPVDERIRLARHGNYYSRCPLNPLPISLGSTRCRRACRLRFPVSFARISSPRVLPKVQRGTVAQVRDHAAPLPLMIANQLTSERAAKSPDGRAAKYPTHPGIVGDGGVKDSSDVTSEAEYTVGALLLTSRRLRDVVIFRHINAGLK
jgi:hypothetical protein